MENEIRITCYGTTKTYKESDRQELIKHFMQGVMCSEGHEQSRYVTIVESLMCGDTEITDECA